MAMDVETTTIKLKKSARLAPDRLVESGAFADWDGAVDAAIIGLDDVRSRRSRLESLLEEGLEAANQGRLVPATSEVFDKAFQRAVDKNRRDDPMRLSSPSHISCTPWC
jgi:Arc/MetJ-type ribon-helix-helix transcriptional regulator